MKRIVTPKILRESWLNDAKSIPYDAPLWAEAMASRIAILIEDVEELERRLQKEREGERA